MILLCPADFFIGLKKERSVYGIELLKLMSRLS